MDVAFRAREKSFRGREDTMVEPSTLKGTMLHVEALSTWG